MLGRRSPLSPWQAVKKSPASQQRRQSSWASSPNPLQGPAGNKEIRDMWSQDRAQKLKRKLQVVDSMHLLSVCSLQSVASATISCQGSRMTTSDFLACTAQRHKVLLAGMGVRIRLCILQMAAVVAETLGQTLHCGYDRGQLLVTTDTSQRATSLPLLQL